MYCAPTVLKSINDTKSVLISVSAWDGRGILRVGCLPVHPALGRLDGMFVVWTPPDIEKQDSGQGVTSW